MADTIPLVELTPNEDFIDVYATTGLPVGTALLLQVFGGTKIIAVLQAAQPLIDARNVIALNPDGNGFIPVSAGESGLWVRSTQVARLAVQDNS